MEQKLCKMCDGVGTIGNIMKTTCAQCKGTGWYNPEVFKQYIPTKEEGFPSYVSGICIPYIQHYPNTTCSG